MRRKNEYKQNDRRNEYEGEAFNIMDRCNVLIVFVTGLGTMDLSYIFFATIEVVCVLLIIWSAWKWPNPEV